MYFAKNLRKTVLGSGNLKALVFFMKAGREMDTAKTFYSAGVPEYMFDDAVENAVSYLKQVESILDIAIVFGDIKSDFDAAYADWVAAAGALLTYSDICRLCA